MVLIYPLKLLRKAKVALGGCNSKKLLPTQKVVQKLEEIIKNSPKLVADQNRQDKTCVDGPTISAAGTPISFVTKVQKIS